jgi:hypothetical protein
VITSEVCRPDCSLELFEPPTEYRRRVRNCDPLAGMGALVTGPPGISAAVARRSRRPARQLPASTGSRLTSQRRTKSARGGGGGRAPRPARRRLQQSRHQRARARRRAGRRVHGGGWDVLDEPERLPRVAARSTAGPAAARSSISPRCSASSGGRGLRDTRVRRARAACLPAGDRGRLREGCRSLQRPLPGPHPDADEPPRRRIRTSWSGCPSCNRSRHSRARGRR